MVTGIEDSLLFGSKPSLKVANKTPYFGKVVEGGGACFLTKLCHGRGHFFQKNGLKTEGGVLFLTTTTSAEKYFEKLRVNIKEKYRIFGLGGQKNHSPPPPPPPLHL